MRWRQGAAALLTAAAAGALILAPWKLALLFVLGGAVAGAARLAAREGALACAALLSVVAGAAWLVSPAAFVVDRSGAGAVVFFGVLGLFAVAFAAPTQDESRSRSAADSGARIAETNRMLGLLFQSQGMLDLAYEKLKQCPAGPDSDVLLYGLGVEYETRGQSRKASEVFAFVAGRSPGWRDAAARAERASSAADAAEAAARGSTRRTLGRYEIERELGRGAMGIVYAGLDPKIHRRVAIKTLRLNADASDKEAQDAKSLFFREAESAGRLSHPNIVRIFDVGEEQDVCFIAMELVEGVDLLGNTVPSSLLPVREVLECVAQAAEALHYAHRQGVVHRDIKPANILRARDGSIRVVDFGIARLVSSSRTETGTLVGTFAYMSPEQVNGRKADGRSDIFSLGVVLFELLTGRRPFETDGELARTFFQITQRREADPSALSPDVPPKVSLIVHKAMMKDPDERYQSASEMAADLRLCAAEIANVPRTTFEERFRERLEKVSAAAPGWIAAGGSAEALQARIVEFERLSASGEHRRAEEELDALVRMLAEKRSRSPGSPPSADRGGFERISED